MFGRPRCREWTPLATQQLRLRSLIQIVGYNIRPPEWCASQCSYYITLHHTTMSAPFYTSERIMSPHPKWKEIDSEVTQKMSSNNVVIRIWCHLLPQISDQSELPPDSVIQTWGVYFSGLRYIGANLALNFTSDCFKSNTLVFQMHGGYFCSYKSLKLDIIPPENELEHGSLSSDSSGKTNLSNKINIEQRYLSHLKESRSISPSKYRKMEKEYSKSQSPVERCFKHHVPTLRSSSSTNLTPSQRHAENPSQIYEHSPENLGVRSATKRASKSKKVDLSETAENYDLRNEVDWVPKYRYYALNFLKSEIRPSYNAEKLQKLHWLQYSIKKRQEAVKDIKERIYSNSAITGMVDSFDDRLTKVRVRTKSNRSLFSPSDSDDEKPRVDASQQNGRLKDDKMASIGPKFTLKLNDLLSFKSKPSPHQRAEHIRLTKQLEILRFKKIILADERDSKLANIRRLKEIYNKLYEENQDIGSELMQSYHTLSRKTEVLKENRLSAAAIRDIAARTHAALAQRRTQVIAELGTIFHIEERDNAKWTICGVPLPVCGDDTRSLNALGDSIAAGYAAQVTCLIASLLCQPLRYKITLLGSASKILDVTDLPDPNIPLFARSGDPTLFRYGMFLLNKCVAQLMYARGVPVADMRPTLANLRRLLGSPHAVSDTSKLFGTYKWRGDGERTHSLRSLVATERAKYGRQFNRFKDAVDGQSPQSVMTLRHRHTKSVGSYHDDNDLSSLQVSTTTIGSESNIYESANSQKHRNSDSELAKLEKVVFTLGDERLDVESQRLVRISSNNEDYLQEDMRKICSDINHFCSTVDPSVDIAKYMQGKSCSVDIEDARTCDDCESNVKGVCEDVMSCAKNVVKDVIVIPSAEFKLDTGQGASGLEASSSLQGSSSSGQSAPNSTNSGQDSTNSVKESTNSVKESTNSGETVSALGSSKSGQDLMNSENGSTNSGIDSKNCVPSSASLILDSSTLDKSLAIGEDSASGNKKSDSSTQ